MKNEKGKTAMKKEKEKEKEKDRKGRSGVV